MLLFNLVNTQMPSKASNKTSINNLLALAGLLILSGCGTCQKNAPVINSFKDRYYELPKSQVALDYLAGAPDELFNYVQINELTYQCEQELTSELVTKCHEDFLEKE